MGKLKVPTKDQKTKSSSLILLFMCKRFGYDYWKKSKILTVKYDFECRVESILIALFGTLRLGELLRQDKITIFWNRTLFIIERVLVEAPIKEIKTIVELRLNIGKIEDIWAVWDYLDVNAIKKNFDFLFEQSILSANFRLNIWWRKLFW